MLSPDTLIHQRYRIVRPIGQGGMGAVYEAIDERLGVTVALKQTLVNEPDLSRAFEREARLLARLQHPALTNVSDYFSESAGSFLVMKFVEGKDLARMLEDQQGPFAVDTVLDWADQLLDALSFLHSQTPPVIHRDIKPQNLKLSPAGKIMLLDFGLAKGLPASRHTGATSGSIFGYTPQYAPLEQIQGTGTDARSDLYALAATLYHLLTGQPPQNALTRATALLNKQPDPLRPAHEVNPQVPAAVSTILAQALEAGIDDRPTSANDMRAALRTARQQGTQDVMPPPQQAAHVANTGPTIVAAPADPPPPDTGQRAAGRFPPAFWAAVIIGSLLLFIVLGIAGAVLLITPTQITEQRSEPVFEEATPSEPTRVPRRIVADAPSARPERVLRPTARAQADAPALAAQADGEGEQQTDVVREQDLLIAVGIRGNHISVLQGSTWLEPQVEPDLRGCLGTGSAWVAPDGNAWVGCFDLLTSRDGGQTWQEQPVNQTSSIAIGQLSALDPQNRVWWITDKTITLLDSRDGSTLATYTAPESTGEEGFPTEAIAFQADGTAWLGGLNINGSDLISFDGERWQTYGEPEDMGVQSFETPKALLVDSQDQLLVATGSGLYTIEESQLVSVVPVEQSRNLPSSPNDLLELPNGDIWLASLGGVGIWDGSTVRTIGRDNGLPSDNVRDIALDAAGRVWLATDYGIAVQDGANGWQVVLPATSGLTESRIGALAVVGTPELPPETPAQTATVSGRVVLNGEPVPDTTVRLCSERGTSYFDEHPCEDLPLSLATRTDQSGTFRFEDVPRGSLELLAFQPEAGWQDPDLDVDIFQAGQEINLGDVEIGES